MTREEAKEMLPIMQAFAKGKEIEFSDDGEIWLETNTPTWSSDKFYRIKSEPKYRPFKTQEECWNEMLKHQPFGWIKHKEKGDCCNILNIYKSAGITKILLDTCAYTFPSLFDEFVFTNGAPFGIKEE